jgi:hypothetical protein
LYQVNYSFHIPVPEDAKHWKLRCETKFGKIHVACGCGTGKLDFANVFKFFIMVPVVIYSVVDPKLFVTDPDPTFL